MCHPYIHPKSEHSRSTLEIVNLNLDMKQSSHMLARSISLGKWTSGSHFYVFCHAICLATHATNSMIKCLSPKALAVVHIEAKPISLMLYLTLTYSAHQLMLNEKPQVFISLSFCERFLLIYCDTPPTQRNI